MQRDEIVKAVGRVAQEQRAYAKATTEWRDAFNAVMKRLINEAAANMMSVEEVSRASNISPSRVRSIMRANALNPKMGKRLLAKTAAEALASNAELLGIEPNQMDMMSPLAYLPAGSLLRQVVIDSTLAATEVPDVPLDEGAWASECCTFERAMEC